MSKRPYTLRRRAEQQAETRRRIVEATVDLHSTVGPARTSLSMIAERAGVQRHTLYAHFPDELSLHLACSGHVYERDPLPDPAPWRAIENPGARLRAGLAAIYGWYERHAQLMSCIARDAEIHECTHKIAVLRFVPFVTAWQEALGAGLDASQRPLLALALSFHTWRTLARDGGLDSAATVEAMTQAVLGARQPSQAGSSAT